jgi:hypothetical protein
MTDDYSRCPLKEQMEILFQSHKEQHELLAQFLNKTEEHLQVRLGGMNEFREQLQQQALTFASKEALEALAGKVEQNMRFIDNLGGRLWAMGAGFAAVSTLLALSIATIGLILG